MSIKTRLTTSLDIEHPILQAPMAFAAGGALAAAVTNSGGLGLIGGGYGDADWLKSEFQAAGNTRVGCGFITWSLANDPSLLTQVLDHKPDNIFLSFGDPEPFVSEIKDAGARLICQVQTLKHAKHAIDAGADIIVAQGAEAGGHGLSRSTMTLVPEVANYIAKTAPDVLLCAAGGIIDGRGLAAALMLGADGALVGSRFWASAEALVHPNMIDAAVNATGDMTIRSSVMDIARQRNWPEGYTARVLQNAFTERWHGDETSLRANKAAHQDWADAWAAGEPTVANTFVGEGVGLIHNAPPAAQIITDMIAQATECLQGENFSIT